MFHVPRFNFFRPWLFTFLKDRKSEKFAAQKESEKFAAQKDSESVTSMFFDLLPPK